MFRDGEGASYLRYTVRKMNISAAARRDPDSPTATSDFDDRAGNAADRNSPLDPHGYSYDD